MKQELIKAVSDFLKSSIKPGEKLLLALSGGADSKALLCLLLQVRLEFPFELHLAHLDHGWRKESATEAGLLKKEAEQLNLPFHFKDLTGTKPSSNLEGAFRELRYSFFREVYFREGCGALLLAHQLDDLQETILKRFFEGAAIFNLKGIEEKSNIDGMRVLRPLLFTPKSALFEYLQESKIGFFEDSTNLSSSFLRGRMRSKLIPELSATFGKNIAPALLRIKSQAEELKSCLDFRTEAAFKSLVKGPIGMFLDLNSFNLQTFELKYLIKRIGDEAKLELSYHTLQKLALFLLGGRSASVKLKGYIAYAEKKRLFFMREDFAFSGEVKVEKEGDFSIGSWKISAKSIKAGRFGGWEGLIKGKALVRVPKGSYILALPKPGARYLGRPFKESLSEVPSFLRFSLPVLYHERRIVKQFLALESGKEVEGPALSIELEYSPR